MKCIINGKIILEDRVAEGMAIVFDEKIEKIAPLSEIDTKDCEIIDACGNYVAPGLVDMHIHGFLGADASDGDADGIRKMAEGIIKNGVTAWCPTTMTVSMAEITKAFDTVREVKSSPDYYGARILGVNSEGPFINPSKKGAQAEEHILKPDADFIIENSDIVKLFTVAPEVDGALDCIKKVTENSDVLVSMGHTNATYEEAIAGIDAGVRHTTHLFNAMTALSHRSPGVVGASLSDDGTSAELIADTFHVSKGLFNLVAKLKGDKLCLITDCTRAGGMPDGEYDLGGQPIFLKGIECRLSDGTIAGSVLKLNVAVRNVLENTTLSVPEVVAAASYNPARAIKAEGKGALMSGFDADIIIADEKFNIKRTIKRGKTIYEA